MAAWLGFSDQISDRDVSGLRGTPQMTGVIKTGSVGETWDEWDAQRCQGVWPCLLITRRSQVQILPPLPTRQRHNRRSTARKHCLRAFVMPG
jgi:hypothetical protein